MSFSIRLNDEEKMLADSYAKLHGMALGEAFKTALFEKIEDEYDVSLADVVLCQDLVQHKMRNFNYFQLTNSDSLATLAL